MPCRWRPSATAQAVANSTQSPPWASWRDLKSSLNTPSTRLEKCDCSIACLLDQKNDWWWPAGGGPGVQHRLWPDHSGDAHRARTRLCSLCLPARHQRLLLPQASLINQSIKQLHSSCLVLGVSTELLDLVSPGTSILVSLPLPQSRAPLFEGSPASGLSKLDHQPPVQGCRCCHLFLMDPLIVELWGSFLSSHHGVRAGMGLFA